MIIFLCLLEEFSSGPSWTWWRSSFKCEDAASVVKLSRVAGVLDVIVEEVGGTTCCVSKLKTYIISTKLKLGLSPFAQKCKVIRRALDETCKISMILGTKQLLLHVRHIINFGDIKWSSDVWVTEVLTRVATYAEFGPMVCRRGKLEFL